MGNIILIAVGIFVVLMVSLGLKKGLVKMLFSIFSLILIIFLIHVLTPMTKEFLKTTPVYDQISGKIHDYVQEHVDGMTKNMLKTGDGNQDEIIDGMSLPKSIKEDLKKNNQNYGSMKVDSLTDYISSYLSDIVLSAVTFILLFILLSIAFFILIRVLDIFTKLPVIHAFNMAGGAVVGLAEAMLILWILCIIITAFSATGWGQDVCRAISENGILSFIYDNNPLN